ncbi:MAG: hypothetical protein K2L25_04555 [Alphaproteobacteria bacterium]|nr:hypothetical protein [Alphaproteobacteria bacterium]
MKFNILTFGFAIMLLVSSAYADEFILGQDDYGGMDIAIGQQCSSGGKILIKCECASPNIGVSALCSTKEFVPDGGCKLAGGEHINANYYCVDAEYDTACMLCKCNNGQTSTAWGSVGSNRVSRTKYTTTVSGYRCSSVSSTEYGCAAGYYQSGGSGATMTCARCPSSGGVYGTNNIGTTDITTCCIPANSSMKDSGGTYTFTGGCCYKK